MEAVTIFFSIIYTNLRKTISEYIFSEEYYGM